MQEWFRPFNIPVVGKTPYVSYGTRQDEINEFLEDALYTMRSQIQGFVIFDDADIDLPNVLRTSFNTGITPALADEAIRILGG